MTEFNARLRRMPRYPAADSYGAGGDDTVLLASNETPWGPPEPVRQAAERAAAEVNRYPDPEAKLLRQRIAERYDFPAERIAVGNGSCELLLAAADILLEEGDEIVYAWPSFSMYENAAAMTGARAVKVPLDAGWCHDLDAMAGQVTAATRMVVLCNPNNPTGTALPLDRIEAFIAGLPSHVTVILDEAYVEFSTLQDPDDSLDLLARHPNLLLLRTFSKVYGLAGLRVGYALCAQDMKQAADLVRQPFSVNAIAQAAGAEAMLHQDEIARRVERIVTERLHMEEALRERGFDVASSQANFAWVGLGKHDERTVMRGLGERGVVVRAGAPLGGEGHLRVTFGTRAENDRFLHALDELVAAVAAA